MSREGSVIAARILGELKDLSALVERMEEGWKRAKRTNDDYYLDGVALNLHGFYSGLERILEKIASSVDGSVLGGPNWHKELLDQTATEILKASKGAISKNSEN